MAEWNYEIFWKETLNLIKKEIPEEEFALWFNMEYLLSAENKIIVTVPHTFYRDQVTSRYTNYIESKLRELTGKNLSIVFEVKPAEKGNSPGMETAAESNSPDKRTKGSSSGAKSRPTIKEKPSHSQLNGDYTFDKYIIGDNNMFAGNAALAIAQNPGISYPVFVIYGGVGLGKTHLMQAIGHRIYENSESKIIYITAESFTNEFISALKEGRMPTFKNKYRYVDALLIDDIHFLENKLETQEELFHTFNALYNAKKQLIFTCDRPVSELKKFNDRLKNRFAHGLNVDLQPPKYETRCAILKKKAEEKNISIPDEVISLISKNISSNIRDLESALFKLIAYNDLIGKPITIETAQEQLMDVFASPKQSNMSIEIIQRVVAESYSLTINDLKGKKKTKNIVFPRQLAMYITRSITDYSTIEIGQFFGGRDHTTVMHSCKIIEERILADPNLDSVIENLKRKIKEYNAKS